MAVKDKIKGIFSESDEKQTQSPNTPEQDHICQMVKQDYDVFKEARQAIEPIWRQEQRFYMGDHWHGLRPDSVQKVRPNSVDNLAFAYIETIVSKLAGWMPFPDFEPQETQDDQKSDDLNAYMPYELRCIKFKQKHIRAVRRFSIHGPLVYKTIYDPTIEGGRGMYRYSGNNDIIPLDLGTFFPDPRIKDFINLQKAKANIIHTRKPIEYFRERFKEQGKKVMPDTSSTDVDIFDEDEYSLMQFNTSSYEGTDDASTDGQKSGLIEYWYRGLPKMMTKPDKEMFREVGEEKLSEGIDPSEAFAKADGSMEGVHCIYVSSDGVFLEHKSYVYDHGHYPIVARTLFPDERSVWGKGFMRDMIKPQTMLNKFAEIAIETSAKSGGSAIVYEEGAIAKKSEWKENRSLSSAMLPVAQGRMNDWKELQGVNVPETIFKMMEYYKDMLQRITGMYDSAQGQSNSNVTSGEQAKALINAASARLNVASELIQSALEEVFTQYIELIAQFYTDERIARVTGKEVNMNREKLMNQVPGEYRAQSQDEMGQPIEEKIPVMEEYVPKFDIRVNMSIEKPHDREYYIQMAFNLLQMQDPMTQLPMIDAEAVKYTIENGRMEPFSVINERIQKGAQQQQQMQEMQGQVEQLSQQVQVMQDMLVEKEQGNMQAQADALKQIGQQEENDFQRKMQERKMSIDEINALSKSNFAEQR